MVKWIWQRHTVIQWHTCIHIAFWMFLFLHPVRWHNNFIQYQIWFRASFKLGSNVFWFVCTFLQRKRLNQPARYTSGTTVYMFEVAVCLTLVFPPGGVGVVQQGRLRLLEMSRTNHPRVWLRTRVCMMIHIQILYFLMPYDTTDDKTKYSMNTEPPSFGYAWVGTVQNVVLL